MSLAWSDGVHRLQRVFSVARRRRPDPAVDRRTERERPVAAFSLVTGRFGWGGGCWVRTNVG